MALLSSFVSSVSWVYVLVGAILLKVLYNFYIGYFHLRDFSGPRLAAYTRLWMASAYAQKNAGQIFLEANQKYGKLTRVGPNHLLTDDPDITRRILAVDSKYTRSEWFDSLRFHPHYTSIASERDPSKHDALRTKVSAGYNTREFTHLEGLVDSQIAKWMARLQRVASSDTRVFDIARSVRTMAMDLSSYMCYSEGLQFGEDDEEADEFWESLEENAPYAQYISVYPGLFSLNWLLAGVPGLKEKVMLTEHNNPGIGRIIKYSRIATDKRFESDAKPVNDMLGSWIKHGLGQYDAETEASIAMVTGAFPVASAVNVTLLHVFSNRRMHEKLMQEIDGVSKDTGSSEPPQCSEIGKLPYLQACLNETLRCFPPITQLRERVVPPSGDTLDGHFVPGGTKIGLNTRALEQDQCFGAEPDIYRPERWIEANPQELAEMKKVHGLIFGYGSTKCLGINQAYMVMTKILFEFLRNFDIQVLRPDQPWTDQNSGVSFHRDFFVALQSRQGN